MAYTAGGIFIADETSCPPGANSERGTGYEGRDYGADPLNGDSFCRPFSSPRMTLAEIKEAIEHKTAHKTWVRDHADRVGSPVKDQSRSKYCWIHAPVRAMECKRIMDGDVTDNPAPLSAFWPGSQIKGGANQGGSGITGVRWLAKHGTCLESEWPPMQFRGTTTPEITASAAKHQITVYEEMDPRDDLAIWTSVILNDPVTVGIPAWGHEVLLTFLVWDSKLGRPKFGFDNSWSPSYGTNGRGILSGRYERLDEAGRIVGMESAA